MGTFLSIDATLNLTWAVVSLAVLLCWQAEWTRESKRALVAIGCVLVLLFPAISTADDIAEQALMYDVSSAPQSLKSGGEFKPLVLPALLTFHAGHGPALPWTEAFGEDPQAVSAGRCTSLLLASSSGIHSPPQF